MAELGRYIVIGFCHRCRAELSKSDTLAALDAPKACSFCHKSLREVKHLVAGPSPLAICNECLGLCNELCNEPIPIPEGR